MGAATALPTAAELVGFHDRMVPRPASEAAEGSALWAAIAENHRQNCLLWEQEDLARRRTVPPAEIAGNKRAIDRHNQKRNDAIERVDEALLGLLQQVRTNAGARLSSETPGAMIDRLSILALKIYHMRLQTQRSDAGRDHVESCEAKLARLIEQRTDLAGCLQRLLDEAGRGESYFKVYRQFKMYNEPSLNPAIYGERRG
jgi:hypothetical protein